MISCEKTHNCCGLDTNSISHKTENRPANSNTEPEPSRRHAAGKSFAVPNIDHEKYNPPSQGNFNADIE